MTERTPIEEPSTDTVFEILSDRSRRRLLIALLERDFRDGGGETVSIGEIVGDGNSDRLEINLVHNHLPKLEYAGLIEWDREANEMRRGPRFEDVGPMLRTIHDHVGELRDDWR